MLMGSPVKSKPGATYHLGRKAMTAVIATDTDWGTSRFIIDDTKVDNHRKSLFVVRSLLGSGEADNRSAASRSEAVGCAAGAHDCYVSVANSKIKRYIRRGLNKKLGDGAAGLLHPASGTDRSRATSIGTTTRSRVSRRGRSTKSGFSSAAASSPRPRTA